LWGIVRIKTCGLLGRRGRGREGVEGGMFGDVGEDFEG
jgi:hypothetical protein